MPGNRLKQNKKLDFHCRRFLLVFVITPVILLEGISHKSVLAKESAVTMVTQQTGRRGKAEPLLWALYTIFNIKSLVLAFQIEL